MTTTPARDERRDRIVAAARTVRLRLGPNAIALAQRGEPIILSGTEADAVADAVIAADQDAAAEARAAALHDAVDKLRASAPAHYMCDSGFGCERCTYDDVISRLRTMAAAARPDNTPGA